MWRVAEGRGGEQGQWVVWGVSCTPDDVRGGRERDRKGRDGREVGAGRRGQVRGGEETGEEGADDIPRAS